LSSVAGKAPKSSGSVNELIRMALEAGFLELAYSMFVIAIATAGLAGTANGHGLPYVGFQWAMAAIGVAAALYILLDLFRRALTSPTPTKPKGTSPSA
jgi:hypothetical protein